jgi:N-acetyltransferase 10
VSSIIDPKINFTEQEPGIKATTENFLRSVKEYLSPHDMKRLEAYVDNLVDFHLVCSQMLDTNFLFFT